MPQRADPPLSPLPDDEAPPLRFSIATWNINSVRLRIDLVARFLNENRPDVLCLQETKCPDGQFPLGEFRKLGYEHVALNGQKGYHGVAIVSLLPIVEASPRDFCDKGDSRHMRVRLGGGADGLEIHNFYVPAGGDEPDPAINDKFAHKLAFVDEMAAWFAAERVAAGRAILVGDLNIAPLEHDVWSHKALAQRRQPHGRRGRETQPRPGRRPLDRRAAPLRAGRAEALYVVELSLARLGQGRQGPPPRPRLGQPGARRQGRRRCGCCATRAAGSAPPTTRR